MAVNCGSSRIYCVLMCVFLATTIGLSTYITYKEVVKPPRETAVGEAIVIAQFPGFFRTRTEQKAIETEMTPLLSIGNVTRVATVKDPEFQQTYCRFRPEGQRRRRDADRDTWMAAAMIDCQKDVLHYRVRRDSITNWKNNPIYHGCCISHHMFVSPSTIPNRYGEDRVLVQFLDRRQYFLTQECKHALGCTGCGCAQEQLLVTALVENINYPDDSPEEYVLEMVELGGCCKCFNNLPPPLA